MKLYETITAENWYQGGFHSPDRRRHCILAHAYDLYPGVDIETTLTAAVRALYPERQPLDGSPAVFNDHPDTTLDDVLRVCKLADV